MKRVLTVIIVLTFAAFVSAAPRPAAAGGQAPGEWSPLLSCPDVNGDGAVSVGDIMKVVQAFGTVVIDDGNGNSLPGPGYFLLYDVDGGGAVSVGDIFQVVAGFGQPCPLVETQVAQAALAAIPYADCQDAVADGYSPGSGGVYVPQMGIHISKLANMSHEFDLAAPFGLVCTETTPGSRVVDQLIGAWYIIPVTETCAVYGVSGPCQDSTIQPVGFGDTNTDEDNQNPPGPQDGWHTHINLCVGPGFLSELGTQFPDPEEECLVNRGGTLLIPIYGWMLHLYHFVPNDDGRFMKWNANLR